MRLGDIVLSRGIARLAIDRPDLSLAGDTAFQLCAHFFRAALLDRIGASAGEDGDGEKDDRALHLLILGSDCRNASRRVKR
jgi:hypothetical protein